MGSVALYPGSFNPWHDGHTNILESALKIFDHVVILQAKNLRKDGIPRDRRFLEVPPKYPEGRVTAGFFRGLLADLDLSQFDAIVRGLRNGHDLEYETNLLYWNQDLGVNLPFVYFIADRNYGHISSSAVRELEALRTKE